MWEYKEEVNTGMIKVWILWEVRGLTPDVGATLVVALDGAGTRSAPTVPITPQNPIDPRYAYHDHIGFTRNYTVKGND